MSTRLKKEVKYRHLNSHGWCKMGLEIDFKEGAGCDMGHNKLKLDDERNEEKRIRIRIFKVEIRINIQIRISIK